MSRTGSTPHDAGILHVTGQARYIDDAPTPRDTLQLAFGQSTVAHGEIQSIDLSGVWASAGVVDVIVAADVPGDNDVSPSPGPEPFLAEDRVHFLGQPIFVVVATSHRAARKAARLGRIEYKERAAIITMDQAIAANNTLEDPIVFAKGQDPSTVFADRHVTGTLDVGGQEHFYLEGQAASAHPQDNGDMLINSSTQHPSEIQHKVAHALHVPFHAVRVETRRMGGGFGGKESQGNALAVACAIAAQRSGKSCKMRYDRDDDMVITGKRHDIRIKYRVGFDATGKLLSVDFEHFVRCGWSMDLSLPVADRAMLHADNAYHLPNVKITSHRLMTNTQSATAYRGFGGPQGMIGIERVMDHIAHDLGIDPLAVRRANFYENGDKTPYHMTIEDSVIAPLVDDLAKACDYEKRRAGIAKYNAENTVLKKGIAITPVKFGISFTLTHLNQAGALVHVYADGSVMINHGGTEMGQGLFTKVAQVAAHAFGLPMNAVKITATDTAKVPNTSATAASSGSDLNGMAVLNACETIKSRISDHLGGKAEFVDGRVVVGDISMPFAKAAASAYQARVSLSATGFYATPKIEWDRKKGQGRPFFYFAYGASCTEVVIDTLTGENRILRTDILHDVGESLNPELDIGQIEGAYVQGAGWLTTEELVWDKQGRLRTHAPSTYKIPACSDRPDIFKVDLFANSNSEDTIYRSKAVGEPPFMHGISAWLALSDAVASTGTDYPALNAPATAERVYRTAKRVAG